jgi:F1F0 ATPase subunit 2
MSASHPLFAVQASIGLVVGILAGLLHFATLHWNVRLLTSSAPVKAIILQLARLGVLAAIFIVLAKLGALTLLCGAVGLLLARYVVLRQVGAPR